MKYVIKTLFFIGFVLMTLALVLLLYKEVGFSFTAKCLFAWGYSSAAYGGFCWVVHLFTEAT